MIDFNTAVFSDGTLLKDKYHLPTIEEWTGIVGYSSTGWYDTPQLVQTHLEPVAFGNTRKTYTTEFQTPGNGIAYALRFKPATVQSQTGYPLPATAMCFVHIGMNVWETCRLKTTRPTA